MCAVFFGMLKFTENVSDLTLLKLLNILENFNASLIQKYWRESTYDASHICGCFMLAQWFQNFFFLWDAFCLSPNFVR